MVVLHSSGEEGLCFIETSELDGFLLQFNPSEAALKERNSISADLGLTSETVRKMTGSIECETPNEVLDKFDGRILLNHDGKQKTISLSSQNLLLRGASVKNTELVFGIVTYVGSDTKIIRNLKNFGLMFSTLEARLNSMVSTVLILNATLILTTTILWGTFGVKQQPNSRQTQSNHHGTSPA